MLKYQAIINQMSLEEKSAMMSGKNTWETVGYDHLNIPSILLSDGPHGLRKQAGAADHLGLNASLPSTCYPTAATVANSWDEELGEALGEHLGDEANALGVHMILGPGLNIKRNPLCGRNFEYFSEDPYLSGKMAAAYIRGIQSKNVVACPKHFAVNNQELRRMSSNSIVDERTLREIYLTGFEMTVKEGRPKAMMSAYNQINGIFANENAFLLQKILVDEWGFDGMVVSDWGGSNDHVLGVSNGSHLEMPSTGKSGMKEIREAVEKGKLKESILDQRVDELLSVVFSAQKQESVNNESIINIDRGHEFAEKVARESIVLLRNRTNLLPLPKNAKVAVIGDFAKEPRYQGAGSSFVNATQVETTLEAIKETSLELVGFARGYIRNQKTNIKLIEEAKILAQKSDYLLVYVGLDEISESEGMDREHMRMPSNQLDLINNLTEIHERIIIVLSSGSAIEMPWIKNVQSVVHGYLGGQAGAKAMVKVLVGEHCPSGKLNESYPLIYEDTPTAPYFPGKEKAAEYKEGPYVGYRYYETVQQPVLFPFGFGLSYTAFEYSDYKVTDDEVSFKITNTGEMDGAEIAQLYVEKKSNLIFRPIKELKGFNKVFLKAGETKAVSIKLDERVFSYFNVNNNQWEVEAGTYKLHISRNVRDVVLTKEIHLEGVIEESLYDNEKMSDYFSGHIKDISDETFEALLGHKKPDTHWDTNKTLDINDTFSQLCYSKSWIGRLVYRSLTYLKKRSEKKGKPNLNILFIYHMPFRSLAKMTGSAITMDMTKSIVDIFNGSGIKAISSFVKATIKR